MQYIYFCNYYRCPNPEKEKLVNLIMGAFYEHSLEEIAVSILNCDQNCKEELEVIEDGDLLFVFADGSKPGSVKWPVQPIYIPYTFFEGYLNAEESLECMERLNKSQKIFYSN